MRLIISFLIAYFILIAITAVTAQPSANKKVVITGARFTYPLVQKWINDYRVENPSVEIVIEPRTTKDPDHYDLLIDAVQPGEELKSNREFLSIGQYLILPFGNASSPFVKTYSDKGLTKDVLTQVYFHHAFGTDAGEKIEVPYTVYTRLQKASAPASFAKYFGFEQQNIQGKGVAGADEHLIKAVLKDQQAISYAHAGLLYDLTTRKVLSGLSIIPVDANDNGKVSNDEHFYATLDQLIEKAESDKLENIPVEYVHLSIAKHGYSTEALKFLKWVIYHGQDDLHQFGYIKPDAKRFQSEKEKFEELASR